MSKAKPPQIKKTVQDPLLPKNHRLINISISSYHVNTVSNRKDEDNENNPLDPVAQRMVKAICWKIHYQVLSIVCFC